jgi:hypothetical protein
MFGQMVFGVAAICVASGAFAPNFVVMDKCDDTSDAQRWVFVGNSTAGCTNTGLPTPSGWGHFRLHNSSLCLSSANVTQLVVSECSSDDDDDENVPTLTWELMSCWSQSFAIQTLSTHCSAGPSCCLNGPWNGITKIGAPVGLYGCDCDDCNDQRFGYDKKKQQLVSTASKLCMSAQ